jgi:formylglycine-generating enzyme required for sulfatase activity
VNRVTRARAWAVLSAVVVVILAGSAATPGMQRAGTFRDCPHCPEMTVVASGSFVMGDEKPPRRVTLDYKFAYSKDKVTFRDWKHCVFGGQCQSLGATTAASLDPVVNVSWVDVQQYLSWLSLETGADYRLLSEAEWEYLARPARRSARVDERLLARDPRRRPRRRLLLGLRRRLPLPRGPRPPPR